ncbi:MAG: substrate-binding domain-containing protein [Chloroflexi bacterium]|nr:substrate-binding domain-containing protein [Chloroflexota bacterium]
MPTIRDVAKRAGVASMTVSRVINNSGYVSEATRAKVEAAVEELGYVPNMLGPSLRFNQTNTLALVVTDITNPFWTTIARGAEDAAHASDYSVILCNSDESPEKQEQYLTMLLKRRIDGILLAPACSSAEPVELIQKQRVAVVVLDRTVPVADVDIIRGDSIGGASQLTKHLLHLGHRQIAMLSGPQEVSTSADRVLGYRQALHEAGLEPDKNHIIWGNYTPTSGYSMTEKILSAVPRPTAIFAANNFIAIGALRALRDAGLKVPEDMSLVSFDDIPEVISLDPFLTTVTQPTYEMGYKATEMLLARLTSGGLQEYQSILLPTEIIVRRSSSHPPRHSSEGST